MLTEGLSYEEQLEDYRLVYELLKRKLRTSYVSQLIKSISLTEIRAMYRAIHAGESPRSGLLPAIDAMPQVRESFLYLSLFASLYRNASQVDIKTEIDVPAILFAWDFLCETFPNHIRERRPYGKVRPANPLVWSIVDGQLIVQHTKGADELWRKDVPGNKVKADKYWPLLVEAKAGKKDPIDSLLGKSVLNLAKLN